MPTDSFSYDEAFDRNIGWVTEAEQQVLRGKRIAIAGMGGVGGVHLLTLARLGVGAFHLSDLDAFELANFNRQAGAMLSTLGRPKVEVMAGMARDINPGIAVTLFGNGISAADIDTFLDGVDLFVDAIDFFALDIRARLYARCYERGIPATIAVPVGMGTGYVVVMPGGMTFEQYFRLEGLPKDRQYVNFLMGLVPNGLHRDYLVDPSRVDLAARRGPSTAAACQLCAGVVAAEATKILLGRGEVRAVPWCNQFDAYRGRWVSRKLRWGNAGPLQRRRLKAAYKEFAAMSALARRTGSEGIGE